MSLSQIPRVLFSLGLLHFRSDVPSIWEPGTGYRQRIFSETPPETNISVNVISGTFICGRTKTQFFENDDVLVSDFAPDKKCLLPPCLAIFWYFNDFKHNFLLRISNYNLMSCASFAPVSNPQARLQRLWVRTFISAKVLFEITLTTNINFRKRERVRFKAISISFSRSLYEMFKCDEYTCKYNLALQKLGSTYQLVTVYGYVPHRSAYH